MDLSVDDYYNRDKDPVPREGKLYNRIAHTYQWEEDKRTLFGYLLVLEFDDIPKVVRDYIVARAASYMLLCVL